MPGENTFLPQVMIKLFKSASTTYSTQMTDFVHKSLIFLPMQALKSKLKRKCHIIRLLRLAAFISNSMFSVSDMSPTQLWTLMHYAGYLTKTVMDPLALWLKF